MSRTNGSGTVNITDAVAVLIRLFQGGASLACVDAADSNDDGRLDLSDAVYLLNHLFLGVPRCPAQEPRLAAQIRPRTNSRFAR
jgi:hypothetical protein